MSNIIGVRNNNVIIPVTPGSNMPAGTIISYSGSIASFTSTAMADSTTLIHKDGWAVCNGASVPKATYSQLFARVDTIWNASVNPLTGGNQSAPVDATNNFRIPNLQGTFLRGVGNFTDDTKDTSLAGFQASQNLSHGHNISEPNGGWMPVRALGSGVSGALIGGTYGAGDGYFTAQNSGGTESRPQNVGVYYLIKLYDNVAAVDVYIPPASATEAGIVTTGAQSFAGVKTFTNGISLGNETLSVYDEGTWTPTLLSGGCSGTSYYTRIGRMVHVFGTITHTSDGSGVTGVTINNLPFASAQLVRGFATWTGIALDGADTSAFCATPSSTSTLVFLGSPSFSGIDASRWLTGAQLSFNITYIA